MAGNQDKIIQELLEFAETTMHERQMIPYVDFVVKDGVIIAKGFNYNRESKDISMFSSVYTIRLAQQALDTGDLSGYSLYSIFEPTIIAFDIALWAGIKDFTWCLNVADVPQHYFTTDYSPRIFAANNPDKITIQEGLAKDEALKLVKLAESKNYFPYDIGIPKPNGT